MNNDIWNARREQLEKAAVKAALDLTEHMGCAGFTLPIAGTTPSVVLALATQSPATAAMGETWHAEPPTEQAWYWHWDGNPDASPFPTSVLYSGNARKCFVSDPFAASTNWCDEYGGYWLRMIEPATATLPPHASGKGGRG